MCAVRSVIDSSVCGANCDYNSYVSVRRYKQRKIATELHRPKWVSLPLVDAILRDDVLISFITPPELSPNPKLRASSQASLRVWPCGHSFAERVVEG